MARTLLEPHGHRADDRGKEVKMDQDTTDRKDPNIRFLSLRQRLLQGIMSARAEQNVGRMNSESYVPAEALQLQPKKENHGENIRA